MAETPDPLRHVCNETASVPEKFVGRVLDLVPGGGYTASDVEREVRCTMEEHAMPLHFGLVLELRDPKASAVWLVWDSRDMVFSLQVSGDCLAAAPHGSAICTEFKAHPGGHTWELTDDPVYRTSFVRT